jgi:hypothetical protein
MPEQLAIMCRPVNGSDKLAREPQLGSKMAQKSLGSKLLA